jgi:hypothetical protein
MILHLTVPEGWTSIRSGDTAIHRKGRLAIRALPIREHPEDVAYWVERTALKGAPVGTRWSQRVRANLVTREGWPALVVEVLLEHDTFKQVRLLAFYEFLDYAAGAEVQADLEDFTREREAVLEILRSARPDWGPQESICLWNLLEGVTI